MPRGALPGAHMAALAAHAQLQPQQGQAHQQQYRRQHRRVGVAELQFELLVDRCGEGLQADDRQGSELHQHMQGNQQGAGQQRRPQQRQRNAKEHAPTIEPQGAGRLFQGWIQVAQGGRHRQEYQWVLGQGHDQNRAAQAFELSAQRHPSKAADKRRHGKRQAQNHPPDAPARQVAALQQPGQGQADQRAGYGHTDHQCQRVAQQSEYIRSPQQMHRLGPAGLPGLEAHIHQGQQAQPHQQQDRQ